MNDYVQYTIVDKKPDIKGTKSNLLKGNRLLVYQNTQVYKNFTSTAAVKKSSRKLYWFLFYAFYEAVLEKYFSLDGIQLKTDN